MTWVNIRSWPVKHWFDSRYLPLIMLPFVAERPQNKCRVGDSDGNHDPTWVHEIFQGILTSETRCLNCETVSSELIFIYLFMRQFTLATNITSYSLSIAKWSSTTLDQIYNDRIKLLTITYHCWCHLLSLLLF